MQLTHLYLKQHNKTGLKYFGKTVSDPKRYNGSSVYWQNHLAKHGDDISTLWVKSFTNQYELTKFALGYSKKYNIVESKEYANLKPEDGLMGGKTEITDEGRRILNEKAKNYRHSEESKEKIRKARKHQTNLRTSQKHSPDTIAKIKEARARQVIVTKQVTCPHCGKIGGNRIMPRYHFDNCKEKTRGAT